MNRRQYLTRTGATVAALAATAGCLDDLPGSDSTDSVPVEDRTGERELDRAVGDLNEAALALFAADDFEEPAEIEFDSAEPTARIESARERLETAADELDADRESEVELLRTYAAVLERLVAVTETVTDETLEDDVETVFDAIGDGDDDLEEASATIDARTEEFATAETRHAEAASDVDGFDDGFEELARIDPAELEDGIATLGDVVDSFVTLGGGLESLLDGYERLQAGRDHMENEAYGEAEPAFDEAESTLESATATLESDEEPPAGIVEHVETAICKSEHLTDAASSFGEGATATAEGDRVAAQRHRDAGDRSLEAARDCSSDSDSDSGADSD